MITSPWASPMHQMTSWWVSPLFSTRTLGSSAASRPSAWESLSSSALLEATIAIGSSGSGIDHGRSTRGSSIAESVSPVSARESRPMAHRSPATTESAGTSVRPNGYDSAPSFSSSSWSSCPCSAPKNDAKWPDTCTACSAVSVPEKTRTRLSRPTYGSLVVLTISATSGPLGSQSIASATAPAGVKTSGEGCSCGDGNPVTARSSSSAQPTPVWEQTGTTGKKVARATAVSRSSVSTSEEISSPPRYRSISVSSSDSSMTPSISEPRRSS